MVTLNKFHVIITGSGEPTNARKAEVSQDIWEIFVRTIREFEVKIRDRYPNNDIFVGTQDERI